MKKVSNLIFHDRPGKIRKKWSFVQFLAEFGFPEPRIFRDMFVIRNSSICSEL